MNLLRILLLLFVMGLFLVAGCLAPSSPARIPSSPEVVSSASVVIASEQNASEGTPPRVVPVSLDDAIPPGAGTCVPMLERTCPVVGAAYVWHELPKGRFQHADLNVSWTAAPTTRTLAVLLFLKTTLPNGSFLLTNVGDTRGFAPLRIDDNLPIYDPNSTTLQLYVAARNLAPPPLVLTVTARQAFHVEGTLSLEARRS